MKIIVTSQGPKKEDSMDPRFGRAAYFILVDTNTGSTESIQNTAANASGGAGISAAQTVLDLNADVLITGRLGPKAFDVLINSELECYQGHSGSVSDNVEAFEQGGLERVTTSGPDHGGIQFHGGKK